MLSLSPAKVLVVLVVALIVLGPEKLPDVARQVGAMWGDLRKWRSRIESEVRGTFPDLPPTHEVVQAVRSPLSFLDKLADAHESTASAGDLAESNRNGSESEPAGKGSEPAGNGSEPPRNGSWGQSASDRRAQIQLEAQAVPDDPSMN